MPNGLSRRRAPPPIARPKRTASAVRFRKPQARGGFGVGANAGGLPALTGMFAAYRADLGVTMNGSSLVSRLADQSGAGHDLTEATNKPLWVANLVNGRPAIRFDGSVTKLLSPGFSVPASQTMVIVAKLLAISGIVASLGSASGPDLYESSSGKMQLERNGVTGTDITVGTGYFAAIVVADASASTFQLNNGAVTGVTDISGTAIEVCLGGRHDASSFCNVEIAEFIALSSVIGSSDRAALLAYLKSLYALW